MCIRDRYMGKHVRFDDDPVLKEVQKTKEVQKYKEIQMTKDEEEEEWEEVDGEDDEEWEDEDGEEEETSGNQTKSKEKKKKFQLRQEDVDLDARIIQKVKIGEGIQMKRYDENGLPIDGYNYYQHLAEEEEGPAPMFEFQAQYAKVPDLEPDIDYKPEEMNDEQKEAFQALEDEDEREEGAGYDELEDDFVLVANEGEACLDEVELPALPAKPQGNALGVFNDNPNVKITFKNGGGLDDKVLEAAMREFDDLDDPRNNARGNLQHDALAGVLDSHISMMNGGGGASLRNRGNAELHLYKEAKRIAAEEAQKQQAKKEKLMVYHDPLKLEEDTALQNYLAREQDSDVNTDDLFEQSEESDHDEPTNITERFSAANSRIHRQLNVIKEEKTGKQKKKKEEQKEPEKPAEEEAEEPENEGDEEKKEKLKKKRNETSAERRERKELIKNMKKERREKKTDFKEKFKTARKGQLKTQREQQGHLQGLAMYKY
eukprot:TRINITY_DN13769_c0_g1_i1.p1 TRINITY_DN13769_c0_g1~~TRINITY_DN13769_c0_g1_i1.p1  ORF type:complete len:487 (+),score=201.95 TRINITY_DN13769_c0_g1_i1:84-1544(+)